MSGNLRAAHSGWVAALFIVLIFIGWQFPYGDDEPPAKPCTTVQIRDDINPDAYAALQDQGYTSDGDTLRSPACGVPA